MKRISSILLCVGLIACSQNAVETASPGFDPQPTSIHTSTVPQQPTSDQPTATPPLVKQQPTQTTAPLQIQFPTPVSNPISIWRAPLYPVPFALSPHDHFLFMRPIPVDEVNWPLDDYRYGYIFPNSDAVHTGIDIAVPVNTPILAAGDGKVIWAGYGLLRHNNDPDDPYGMAVAIRHSFGFQGRKLTTVYAHMERVDVEVGQSVKMGDQIGIVGVTGFTTGPHLHFEVRVASKSAFTTRNPELWISPPEGCGLIAGRVTDIYGNYMSTFPVQISSMKKENWSMYTYGPSSINRDDFYEENLVLSNLPQGTYTITLNYRGKTYSQQVEVFPGSVSFFTFRGTRGFSMGLPIITNEESWLIPYQP